VASRSISALAVVVLVLLIAACGGGEMALPGTNLGRSPAPDFRLTDQSGRSVALAELRGRAVVLAFLYATCPDFCPATAVKLRQTVELMGKDATRVVLLAVSVDPDRDDQQAAQRFSARYGMPERLWHFLTGTQDELAPVWQAYGIGRVPRTGAAPPAGASMADALGHTEAVYVIDTKGRERTLLRGDFNPAELAAALRGLVR
jgi:protein SCO1/2